MRAIVLQRSDAAESDRVVTLLSRERGKVEAFVKGVKKITGKNGPFLEPFFLIEAESVPGKELDKLTRAYPLKSFAGIRGDLAKMRLAGYAAYFLNVCLHAGGRSEEIFDLFLSWLVFLDKTKAAVRPDLLYALMIKIYSHLGFTPGLSSCTHCGKAMIREYKKTFFSLADGGIICSACRGRIEPAPKNIIVLSAAEYKLLRTLLRSGWELIGRLKRESFTEKIERLIFDFIRYRTERNLAKFSEI